MKRKKKKVKTRRKLKRARKHKKLKNIMSEEISKIRTGRTERCSDISCLNAATYVLKIDNGMVKNFLAQERRLQVKLQLMGKSY